MAKTAKRASKKKAKDPADNPPVPLTAAQQVVNPDDAMVPGQTPPAADPGPKGLEEVDRTDMVIPRFSIVQPMSDGSETSMGMIRDAISGEDFEGLEGVVLLKVRKGRIYFAKDDDDAEGLICASDDRVFPAKRIESPVSTSCAGCPSSEWVTVNGRRKPPACGEDYTFLLTHDGMPYFMSFKSAAIKDVKKLLTQLTLKCRKERLDSFAFQFDVGTEKVKYDTGFAYQPRFANLKKVSKADLELYAAMYEEFAHQEPTVIEDTAAPEPEDSDFAFGKNAGTE